MYKYFELFKHNIPSAYIFFGTVTWLVPKSLEFINPNYVEKKQYVYQWKATSVTNIVYDTQII